MRQYDIDIQKCPIGIIPYGSGWGSFQKSSIFSKNYQLLYKWLDCKITPFDIWQCQIHTKQNGYFLKIQKKNNQWNQKKVKNQDHIISHTIKRLFSNYFSVGIDARIGYSFDKYRTKSRILNKFCYCCLGFLKFFKSTQNIQQYVTYIGQMPIKINQQTRQQLKDSIVEFYQNKSFKIGQKSKTIIGLNIDSYMSGVKGIWTNSKPQIKINYKGQKQFDGILQFVSFKNLFLLGLQRIVHGQARKVGQGCGPFRIQFNKHKQCVIFINLDGEFYQIVNPDYLNIQLSNIKLYVMNANL